MGLISRLGRITKGRIEAFLDSIEKPELILPQLVKELGENVKQAANAEAKALTAVKATQRKLDEATGRLGRLREGAKLAVAVNELDTARKAIAAQMETEREIESQQKSLAVAEQAYAEAATVRKKLSSELEELKCRKKEILQRAKLANTGSKIDNATLLRQGRNVLDIVARMDAKVEDMEIAVAARNEVDQMLLSDISQNRLEELLRDAEVQRRMDELKKKIVPE